MKFLKFSEKCFLKKRIVIFKKLPPLVPVPVPPEYNFSPSPESPAELFSFVSFVPDVVLFWLRELEPPLPDSLVVAEIRILR